MEAINSRKYKIPRFVVIVPDKDFIEQTNFYGFGASEVFTSSLNWLIKQIEMVLERKEEAIISKKPGALPAESTKIVWIKMLKQPHSGFRELEKVLALRNHFNNSLEEVLTQKTKFQHYIMSIRAEERDFYLSGDLINPGQTNFWWEVDLCMKRFDKSQINLKPRSFDNSGQKRRRKMPTPPPTKKHHSSSYREY